MNVSSEKFRRMDSQTDLVLKLRKLVRMAFKSEIIKTQHFSISLLIVMEH
jgi:hypothetical protein